MTGLDEVLGVGVDRLLRSAEARGQALPAGPAVTTVAVVLLHRDSRVRAGLPEITAALAREILTGILPTLAAPARDDLGVCARVLKALADEQHAARLLSAKKLAKLHAAVDESTADYEEALVAPERTTWERFYARLMRDEGVEVTDESAVRVWLARYRERPLADRKAAFLAATTAPDEIEPTGAASARHARAAVVGQLSEAVRSGVELGVRAFYLPYLYQEDGRDESAFARIEAWVDRVIDGVTAAGLSKALREEFRDLAPSEDILVGPIVAELSDRREDYGGCLPPVLDLAPLAPRVPVPGVNGGDTADTAALVRSAPLLSAAAGLARWVDERGGAGEAELGRHLGDTAAHLGVPEPVMERVARFARAVSMLRVQDGRVAAGEAWSIWREGDADDLLNLAVTSYAAVRTMVAGLTGDGDGHGQACDQGVGQPAEGAERGEREPDTPGLGEDDDPFLASDEDDDLFLEPDEFTSDEDDERVVDGDVPVLFELFGQQGTASVARLAAIGLDWVIQRAREPVLPVPPAGPEDPGASLAMSMRAWDPLDPGAYALPDDDELERLIGLDEPLDADERAELARQARLTALVADRMAGLGLVCRAGDTVMLSSLGERVMGSLASQAGWNVPTLSEVAAAEPAVMARWLGSWPAWARVAGLLLWAGAG
ncbi:hypothetical protein, partial [Pseudofrankia sp. BMG5.36]|uniref:hypothetical protein n=1 Tax=Pseudofrankia sp. BMG5.36 TaxID=1834512 RepID=UPI001041E03D